MHDSSVKQGNRGPWNYEQLWKPHGENQAAYVLPPLRNFADGPSGFTHYPGVGLAAKYRGYFFLCDFRGSPAGSGVWAFTTKPKGEGTGLGLPLAKRFAELHGGSICVRSADPDRKRSFRRIIRW